MRLAVSSNVLDAKLITESDTPEQVLSTRNKPMSHGRGDEMLRRNSQHYDNVMKERKEELRRKRGALEINSDLDFDSEFKS